MDYNVQAFVSIPSLADNDSDNVALLGTLSTSGATSARVKQYYDKPDDYDAVSLVIFNCSNATSSGGVDDQIKITDAIASPALYLSQTLFDTYDQVDSVADFVQVSLVGNFTVENSSNVIVHGGKSLPKYLKFSFVDGSDSYNYQLWFSDDEFKSGSNPYTGFEVVVIPPVTDMDGKMYKQVAIARPAYDAQQKNRKELTASISAIISQSPATDIVTYELKWNDPSDLTEVILTEWTMVCYGRTGSSPTNLLAALREWIEANSTHSVSDWASFFPEIETSDFFTFVPMWTQTSKVSTGVLLYSPIFKVDTGIAKMTKFFPTMTDTEVRAVAEIIPAKYNQLILGCVPGLGNAVSRLSFYGIFGDYSVLQLNTPQASAFSEETLQAIEALESLLILAESYNSLTTTLPTGTSIVDNPADVPYQTLERSVNGFVFKVITKASYTVVNPS